MAALPAQNHTDRSRAAERERSRAANCRKWQHKRKHTHRFGIKRLSERAAQLTDASLLGLREGAVRRYVREGAVRRYVREGAVRRYVRDTCAAERVCGTLHQHVALTYNQHFHFMNVSMCN
jgi:hypothetical protein